MVTDSTFRCRNQRTLLGAGAWSALAAILMGCSAGEDPSGITSKDEPLVLGTIAGPDDLPSAVWLGGCSGSKVGPRQFLTAAHCAGSGGVVASDRVPGSTLKIWRQNVVDSNNPTYTVKHVATDMHPDTDVAVFTADQDTPSIPIAPVLERPIYLSDPIIHSGYGCEERDGFGANYSGHRLRFGEGFVADNNVLSDYPINTSRSKSIFTASTSRDPNMVGLCPGDSGGPLFYRLADGRYAVAGVNAAISTGVNIISRVDSSSQTDVFTWLKNLGVAVISQEGTTPYLGSPIVLPGTVEAENFDSGRPEVAYHETDGINGPKGWYRPEPVDLDPVTDAPGNFNIGGIQAGEWLEYSIVASEAGMYELDVRGSAWQENQFHIELDGNDVTGTVSAAETGGLQNFGSNVLPAIGIESGEHKLRIVFESGGWNFDAINFTQLPATCTDSFKNGTESDVDCGGECATLCDDGRLCSADSDCKIQSCIAGICSVLPDGSCQVATDCATGEVCEGGMCVVVSEEDDCSNGLKDGDETDIDCGGSCAEPCTDGSFCLDASDCDGGDCVDGVCSKPIDTTGGSTTDPSGCSLGGGRMSPFGSSPVGLALVLLAAVGVARPRKRMNRT